MDDEGKPPHMFGSGHQRGQHPRPFFYVQPPSQPYVVYHQWPLNNPYSHYGMPGGFNFPRPCMNPYQYMQYPGYMVPQAHIYPMDHRRMFEPRFHGPSPSWGDGPRQQYHPHPHPHPHPQGRREMACSEAQTDANDAITKLIECLDKIRGAERELDSGVASQSSGMFSPGVEKKSDEQGQAPPPAPDGGRLESPAVFGDSTTAVYDAESSQRSLDALSPPGCWSGELEEEPPLDSSSVQEECSEAEEPFLPPEKAGVTDVRSDTSATAPGIPKRDAEELQTSDPVPSSTASMASCSSDQPELKAPKTERQEAEENDQMLKLRYDALTPRGAAAGRLSSPAAAYYYNYLSMHTTHERMSVLSPSLDELSSRDEMFSTDLDDSDLFPKHVYTGRRLAEVVSGSSQAAEDEAWAPGSTRPACSCCGQRLAKASGRSKAPASKAYGDDDGDSDEDGGFGREREPPVRVVVRKHPAARKPHPVLPRHAAKPRCKRGQYKVPSDGGNQEENRDQEAADGQAGDGSDELHCGTCQDRLCREVVTTAEQGRWGGGAGIPRRRQGTPLHREETSAQRKLMYHRPRDEDDDEPPPLHWERGSMMRESRC